MNIKYLDENLLIDLYVNKKWTIHRIAKRLFVSNITVKKRLLKLGIELQPRNRQKKYQFNEDFFATPNELNSYWAGFIAADFCIRTRNGNDKISVLDCSLGEKDKDHLERFMNDIEHMSPVRVRQRIRNGTKLMTAEISISSKKMIDDLFLNFNICPENKTKRLIPPSKLIREHNLAFITGYIDGDGWVQYRNDKHASGLNLGVCGTYEMVSWIKNYLDEELHKVGIKECTGKVVIRENLCVWRANIYSWYLAKLLESVPITKMNRKLPQIHKYIELHKEKFKNKELFKLLKG